MPVRDPPGREEWEGTPRRRGDGGRAEEGRIAQLANVKAIVKFGLEETCCLSEIELSNPTRKSFIKLSFKLLSSYIPSSARAFINLSVLCSTAALRQNAVSTPESCRISPDKKCIFGESYAFFSLTFSNILEWIPNTIFWKIWKKSVQN